MGESGSVRQSWLAALAVARGVLASPEVARKWDGPSALPEFTVRGLAGHLLRAPLALQSYLDAPEPAGEPIPAAAYFPTVLAGEVDLASPLNVLVRERGEQEARRGHAGVLAAWDGAATGLAGRLPDEPAGRKVAVFRGLVMRLDDYLVTRIVEVVVHADDLAVSVGLPTPAWPRSVADLAIDHLVACARHRHGDLAVLRALSRRERDRAEALRVF
jgi:uncharacterized protein (TIGR03083 family)